MRYYKRTKLGLTLVCLSVLLSACATTPPAPEVHPIDPSWLRCPPAPPLPARATNGDLVHQITTLTAALAACDANMKAIAATQAPPTPP